MHIVISVAEDNKTYRDSLVQLINSTADLLLCRAYENGESAMDLLHNPPDIAIVDIQLPGMSGIELIRQIRHNNSSVLFLICSVHDDDEKVFSALEAGALGYILKDSTSKEILEAIYDLYKGGSPMSPYIARKVIASLQKPLPGCSEYMLSDREREVLQLLAKGLMYKEIAERMAITRETVKKHLKNVYQKLHVQNKIEALNKLRLL